MTGFFHVAVAVLSLLSVGQSAPVSSCESLIQPLEIQGREQLLGKWTYLAESTNIPGSNFLTKMFVETAWGEITAANESGAINAIHSQKMFGRCFTLIIKMTLENNTLSMLQTFTTSTVLLNTGCPDCLVSYSKYTIGGSTYSGIQLASMRNKVTAAELEEFTKQVECLNLTPPTLLEPEKGFCPDGSSSQETTTIDLTSFSDDTASKVINLFDKMINSEGGLKRLTEMISSAIGGLKEN
ncbi:uncharacterized protein LOC123970153 [Micropterus dolomieu]|uniref:uncharacterized protein LOC123970153 n=1 Tax=Micropterus dolomieu TaxID=147949 RepID=UPI001E8DB8BD|nr:uncharacterized protein LOC123970153 [Micropterus dolomieu]